MDLHLLHLSLIRSTEANTPLKTVLARQLSLVASFLGLAFLASVTIAQEPNRYYLGIGVEDYEHESLRKPLLKYCVDDVTALSEVLKDRGYDVKLLTDEAAKRDKSLTPTKENIDREVKKVLDTAKRGDAVILAFAGHGLQFAGDRESYFCPMDARPLMSRKDSLVSTKSIYEAMEASHASSRILLVDACRNDPDPTRGRGIDPISAPPPRGVAVFFSCDAGQKALENDKLGHGVFFHHLIEGLSGKAADRASETVTTNSLASHVAEGVEKDTDGAQQPVFDSKQIGKPFVFVNLKDLERSKTLAAGTVREFTDMKIKFCYCPPGKFLMGSPRDEKDRGEDEDDTEGEGGKQVEVELTKGFWLGQTEVTQKQWFDVMGTRPWRKVDGSPEGTVKEGDDYAVSYISYEMSLEFCAKLTETDRLAGRLKANERNVLPTEAQWEYACRSGTQTRYSFGDDKSRLSEFAWYGAFFGGSAKDELYAHRVGQKKPNAWGMTDMHGNVFEWCLDAAQNSLVGGRDPHVEGSAASKFILRGGSWYYDVDFQRSASRIFDEPRHRMHYYGFRLARTD